MKKETKREAVIGIAFLLCFAAIVLFNLNKPADKIVMAHHQVAFAHHEPINMC